MTKGWKIFWIAFDVLFLGAYFLYGVAFADPGGAIRYHDGRYNTYYRFALVMAPVFYWWLMLIVLAVLGVRLYFWKEYFRSTLMLWTARGAVIACNPISILIVASFIPRPSADPFLRGYGALTKSNVPVEEIRSWLTTISEDTFTAGPWQSIEHRDNFVWPDTIIKLYPNVHTGHFFRNDEGQECLELINGGGWDMWGIVIGPKEMQIEDSDFRIYWLEIQDGVYAWHER